MERVVRHPVRFGAPIPGGLQRTPGHDPQGDKLGISHRLNSVILWPPCMHTANPLGILGSRAYTWASWSIPWHRLSHPCSQINSREVFTLNGRERRLLRAGAPGWLAWWIEHDVLSCWSLSSVQDLSHGAATSDSELNVWMYIFSEDTFRCCPKCGHFLIEVKIPFARLFSFCLFNGFRATAPCAVAVCDYCSFNHLPSTSSPACTGFIW